MNKISVTTIGIHKEAILNKYYDKSYRIFSFEIMNDVPLALTLSTNGIDFVIHHGLDKLKRSSKKEFINFLKTIKVKNNLCFSQMSFDIEYAKDKYGVIIDQDY